MFYDNLFYMSSLTEQYNKFGVDEYYRMYSDTYVNPHTKQICTIVNKNYDKINQYQDEYVLDLCCGNGEITDILTNIDKSINVIGCDPYMYEQYKIKSKRECLQLSFDDIIKRGLPYKYSSIICSYGMHLCPSDNLSSLVYKLSLATNQIVIITPHKRPNLANMHGFQLVYTDTATKEDGKLIRLFIYEQTKN